VGRNRGSGVFQKIDRCRFFKPSFDFFKDKTHRDNPLFWTRFRKEAQMQMLAPFIWEGSIINFFLNLLEEGGKPFEKISNFLPPLGAR
jgi:hypothetical protein